MSQSIDDLLLQDLSSLISIQTPKHKKNPSFLHSHLTHSNKQNTHTSHHKNLRRSNSHSNITNLSISILNLNNSFEQLPTQQQIYDLPLQYVAILNEVTQIQQLLPWQKECLLLPKPKLGGNIIFSFPTSGGKTFVSDIFMLRSHFRRPKSIALYVLPFLTLLQEKKTFLNKIANPLGLNVEALLPGNNLYNLQDHNVLVATYEKSNSILAKLIESNLIQDLSIVIIDELHLIADVDRGSLLEILLEKILYLNSTRGLQIQIIGMSATIPNLNELAFWLKATLYISNERPVQLKEYVKVEGSLYDKNGAFLKSLKQKEIKGDHHYIMSILQNTPHSLSQPPQTLKVPSTGSVLIFVASKIQCQNLCQHIHRLGNHLWKEEDIIFTLERNGLIKQLINFSPRGWVDEQIKGFINMGLFFHHGGLTSEQRQVIEEGFKDGIIRILVCTTTLATGVNLPVQKVIIATLKKGNQFLTTSDYLQMIGRAGRLGSTIQEGESYLLCKAHQKNIAFNLVQSKVQRIVSPFHQTGLSRAILDGMALKLIKNSIDLQIYLKESFILTNFIWNKKEDQNSQIKEERVQNSMDLINQESQLSIEFLLSNELVTSFINQDSPQSSEPQEKTIYYFKTTSLGQGIGESNLAPEEMMLVYLDLERANQCLVLENGLHLLYQLTPIFVGLPIDWNLYLTIYNRLGKIDRLICEEVGIEAEMLLMYTELRPSLSIKDFISKERSDQNKGADEGEEHKQRDFESKCKNLIHLSRYIRFYNSMIIKDLLMDNSQEAIAKFYHLTLGQLQGLQYTTPIFGAKILQFCKHLKWWNLYNLLSHYQQYMHFSEFHEELDELLELQILSNSEARAIYQAGFTQLSHIAHAKPIAIYKAIQNSQLWKGGVSISMEQIYSKPCGKPDTITIAKATDIVIQARIVYMRKKRKIRAKSKKYVFKNKSKHFKK